MKISEGELDHAFACALEDSVDMREWLLREGRFERFSTGAELLIEEQAQARSGDVKNWWRYWWCKMPDGSEGETDLFFVFRADNYRFALHIENKPPTGLLTINQASGYRRRAAFMANTPRWLNYIDFETILLSPKAFAEANSECAKQFDRTISYESASEFVPEFGAILGL